MDRQPILLQPRTVEKSAEILKAEGQHSVAVEGDAYPKKGTDHGRHNSFSGYSLGCLRINFCPPKEVQAGDSQQENVVGEE